MNSLLLNPPGGLAGEVADEAAAEDDLGFELDLLPGLAVPALAARFSFRRSFFWLASNSFPPSAFHLASSSS